MATHHSDIPYFAEGEVVSGFGRGSKELGIPTANFPESVIRQLPSSFECGVYYGWAKLSSYPQVFKMTMCVGWNPYYHNTVKTMETHIIHKFDSDFYGDIMKIIVLGFMRPMCDYPSLDALKKAIHNDIDVASKHLDTEESLQFKDDPFFMLVHPNVADENKGAVNANQSISTENHEKPHETYNNSDDIIITPVTKEMNGNALSPNLMPKSETGVSVSENGICDDSPDCDISSKKNIQSSKSSLSKSDFSHPVIECKNICKDSI